MRSKLVVYLGGPRARPGDYCWWYRDGPWLAGMCCAAAKAGAEIPDDTYHDADPEVSSNEMCNWELRGTNSTALLPLEVDE